MIKLSSGAEVSKEELYRHSLNYLWGMPREELFYQLCMYGGYDDYEANEIIDYIERSYGKTPELLNR